MDAKRDFEPLLLGGLHPKSLEELRQMCVAAFPLSGTRERIMTGLEFVVQTLEQVGVVGDLWVNGSFMTQAIDPADVDIALRISAEVYDSASAEAADIFETWFKRGALLSEHGCDAFLFCEFPPDSPHFFPEIQEYWLRQFGTGHDEVSPKGIAVIYINGGQQ